MALLNVCMARRIIYEFKTKVFLLSINAIISSLEASPNFLRIRYLEDLIEANVVLSNLLISVVPWEAGSLM